MSLESYYSLLSTFGIILIGAKVLYLNQKSWVNWNLFFLSLLMSMMTMIWYEMSQAQSYEEALFCRRYAAIWPLIYFLTMYITYLRSGLPITSRIVKLRWPVGAILFYGALFFVYIDFYTDYYHGGLKMLANGQWAYDISQLSVIDYFRISWVITVIGMSIWFVYYKYKNNKDNSRAHLLKISYLGLTISLIATFVQGWILPIMGFDVSQNVSLSCVVGMLLYGWTFTDFKLFDVQAESAIEQIVDNMTNLLILTNNDLQIKKINHATAQLFACEESEIVYSPLRNIFDPYDAELGLSFEKIIQERKGKKEVSQFEFEITVANQQHFLVFNIASIFNSKNKQTGYALIGTDLTKYKEAELSIRSHAEELEKSNEALERFAYIASHDLKEPVRTANGFIGLLDRKLKNLQDEDVKEYMSFIKENLHRMHHLIDSALLVSRYNGMDIKYTPFQPSQLIQQIEKNLGNIIREKKARIEYSNMPQVIADKDHFELLFQNLVENGLKYNESEAPVISVSCENKERCYEFSFKDNGIGIQAEYKNQIFQMFKRLHNRTKYKGTGIGLAICKRIVEKHKGQIWAESTEGKGTTFKFTIPKPETGQRASSSSKLARPRSFGI